MGILKTHVYFADYRLHLVLIRLKFFGHRDMEPTLVIRLCLRRLWLKREISVPSLLLVNMRGNCVLLLLVVRFIFGAADQVELLSSNRFLFFEEALWIWGVLLIQILSKNVAGEVFIRLRRFWLTWVVLRLETVHVSGNPDHRIMLTWLVLASLV